MLNHHQPWLNNDRVSTPINPKFDQGRIHFVIGLKEEENKINVSLTLNIYLDGWLMLVDQIK